MEEPSRVERIVKYVQQNSSKLEGSSHCGHYLSGCCCNGQGCHLDVQRKTGEESSGGFSGSPARHQ